MRGRIEGQLGVAGPLALPVAARAVAGLVVEDDVAAVREAVHAIHLDGGADAGQLDIALLLQGHDLKRFGPALFEFEPGGKQVFQALMFEFEQAGS